MSLQVKRANIIEKERETFVVRPITSKVETVTKTINGEQLGETQKQFIYWCAAQYYMMTVKKLLSFPFLSFDSYSIVNCQFKRGAGHIYQLTILKETVMLEKWREMQ